MLLQHLAQFLDRHLGWCDTGFRGECGGGSDGLAHCHAGRLDAEGRVGGAVAADRAAGDQEVAAALGDQRAERHHRHDALNDAAAVYHPYWRNPHVTGVGQDVLVSLWQLPDRVMLGVFNYDRKQAKDVTLKLDLARLGLAGRDGFDLATRDLFRPEGAADVAFDAATGSIPLKGLQPHAVPRRRRLC